MSADGVRRVFRDAVRGSIVLDVLCITRRFELLYYTAGAGQWCLTVDTRFHESEGGGTSKPTASRPKDDFTTTAQALCLEKVIHTKYVG